VITLLIIIFELFTKFFDGKINSNDNSSGHFRPNSKSLPKVKAELDKLYKENPNLFDKGSEWRKK